MGFNFPLSPAVGDVYQYGNVSYQWNGVAWTLNVLSAKSPPRVQVKRTETPNHSPASGSLAPGELAVEMADPMRLWVGVPVEVDATERRALIDTSTLGSMYVHKSGDTMAGPLVLHADPINPLEAATKQYVDVAGGGGGGGEAAPPSDALPLPSGVAAPGVLAAYSRGDHKHPTDASRVAKVGDTMTGPLTIGYTPFPSLKILDTATGYNKTIRMGSGNGLEFINSANTTVIATLGDLGGLSLVGNLTAQNVSGADFTAIRGGGPTGYVFLGSGSSHYIGFDGTRYQMPNGPVAGGTPQLMSDLATAQWVANSYQPALGFTPVQQGGGAGQGTNKVYIGWANGTLKCQVDASDQGSFLFTTGGAAVLSTRLAYAGDVNCTNSQQAPYEPYPGSVITGWYYGPCIYQPCIQMFRHRYLQVYTVNGWFTAGYT